MGFFAVSAFLYARPYAKYAQEERRLIIELEAEKEIAVELEKEKSFKGTDAFVEKIARERLGYVRPDEIVFYNVANQ
jgi:cell division protein FtsB